MKSTVVHPDDEGIVVVLKRNRSTQSDGQNLDGTRISASASADVVDFDQDCELWTGVLFPEVQYDIADGGASWLAWLYYTVLMRLDELSCLVLRIVSDSALGAPAVNLGAQVPPACLC